MPMKKGILTLIEKYGMIDGAHHKQWLLDQILRLVLIKKVDYDKWVEEYDRPKPNIQTGELEEYEEWDIGIAP